MPLTRWEFRMVPCHQQEMPLKHSSRFWSCLLQMWNDLRLWDCFGIFRRNINLSLLLYNIYYILQLSCIPFPSSFVIHPHFTLCTILQAHIISTYIADMGTRLSSNLAERLRSNLAGRLRSSLAGRLRSSLAGVFFFISVGYFREGRLVLLLRDWLKN